jgi:methyl-accepting chemotaxis protein
MRAVQGHRGASQGVLAGNAQLKGKMDEFAAAAGTALGAGDATHAASVGLPKATEEWGRLKRDWEELRQQALTLPAPESLKRHGALVAEIQEFIAGVAADSHAALDPEVESNYLQAVFADHLPKMIEALGISRAKATGVAAQRELDWTVRVDLMILRRIIADNRGEIEEHLAGAAERDALIRTTVEAKGKEFLAATQTFQELLDKEILDPATITMPAPKVFEIASRAVDTGYAVVDVTMKEFDRKIQERLERQKRARNITLTVVGLALMVLVLLYLGFRRALVEAIDAIRAGAERIAAGDLATSVALVGKDELVQIGQAINRMQGNLKQSIEHEREISQENLRIRIALDNVSTGVMIADTSRNIIYANQAVVSVLRGAQDDIRKQLPAFDADKLIGTNIDSFHKNPAHQAKLLAEFSQTYVANLVIGERHMTVAANPVIDKEGLRLGTVAEWRDRTAEFAVEHEIAEIVQSAMLGKLDARIDPEGKTGFFAGLAEGINELLETVRTALKATSEVLGRVAQGDLTHVVTGEYSGTFGQLKDDTNTTVERLREVVGQIKEATEAINTAAQEIAAGNQDLSGRTEEQASSLEETASSMEEINSTVKNNADNAKQAADLARNSNSVAEKGGQMVGRVVETMVGIQSSSQKIADIIGVIDSIAFQTNILALNAAVEAARAGEQGRGFAVVATEVRNLAQRSADAAKEIKLLIDESVGKVEGGVRLVHETGETINEVVGAFQQLAQLVGGIAEASREQASGIEQVSNAVTQMDEVTQQNAALVEEAAAAAESLEEQAQGLRQAVAMFSLDSNAVLPAPTIVAAAPATRRVRPPAPQVKRLPPQKFADDDEDEWAEF